MHDEEDLPHAVHGDPPLRRRKLRAQRIPRWLAHAKGPGRQILRNLAEFVKREKYYLDVHCSVWTPESFVDVFSRVIACGHLDGEIVGPIDNFPGSGPEEFLVYLRKNKQAEDKLLPGRPISS